MKPQTEEQWLMVLAVIERLYAEVRAGNWDGLRQMLHGYTTPASVSPEPAAEPAISDNPSDKCCMDIYRSLDHDEAKRELRVIYVAWKRGQVLMCPSSTKAAKHE